MSWCGADLQLYGANPPQQPAISFHQSRRLSIIPTHLILALEMSTWHEKGICAWAQSPEPCKKKPGLSAEWKTYVPFSTFSFQEVLSPLHLLWKIRRYLRSHSILQSRFGEWRRRPCVVRTFVKVQGEYSNAVTHNGSKRSGQWDFNENMSLPMKYSTVFLWDQKFWSVLRWPSGLILVWSILKSVSSDPHRLACGL